MPRSTEISFATLTPQQRRALDYLEEAAATKAWEGAQWRRMWQIGAASGIVPALQRKGLVTQRLEGSAIEYRITEKGRRLYLAPPALDV